MNTNHRNDKQNEGETTMMTPHDNMKTTRWAGFAASIPGGGHIRRGIPCQDASAVMTAPRPAVIVCDGRGSASLSHFGAQDAVKVFRFQTSVLEPFLVNILDSEEEKTEQWIKFCRIMYRTLMQVKYDLAEQYNTEEKEFDCTVAFAIAGTKHIGCFQVGDGSIVLRQNGICKTIFLPEKGEFANQTHFLRAGGEEAMKFQYTLMNTAVNSGIAITSDGPEHLMFRLSDMTPGKIFDTFLEDLRKEELTKQDLMDYLARREWANDPRGSDDRSLAVLARIGVEPVTLPESKVEEKVEVKTEATLVEAVAQETEVAKVNTEAKVESVQAEAIASETAVPESKAEVKEEFKTEPAPAEMVAPETAVPESKAEVKMKDKIESVPELKKKARKYVTTAVICVLSLGLLAETAYLLNQDRLIIMQESEIRNQELIIMMQKRIINYQTYLAELFCQITSKSISTRHAADTGSTDANENKETNNEEIHHAE